MDAGGVIEGRPAGAAEGTSGREATAPELRTNSSIIVSLAEAFDGKIRYICGYGPLVPGNVVAK